MSYSYRKSIYSGLIWWWVMARWWVQFSLWRPSSVCFSILSPLWTLAGDVLSSLIKYIAGNFNYQKWFVIYMWTMISAWSSTALRVMDKRQPRDFNVFCGRQQLGWLFVSFSFKILPIILGTVFSVMFLTCFTFLHNWIWKHFLKKICFC